jgi:hypothetical protein
MMDEFLVRSLVGRSIALSILVQKKRIKSPLFLHWQWWVNEQLLDLRSVYILVPALICMVNLIMCKSRCLDCKDVQKKVWLIKRIGPATTSRYFHSSSWTPLAELKQKHRMVNSASYKVQSFVLQRQYQQKYYSTN